MKIAAIVPAYNEANHIGKVLEILKQTPLLDEVLIVDDGSADGTAEIAEELGFKVLKMTENQGKGAALQAGIKQINTDIYLFIDADLVGLQPKHLEGLVNPLLEDTSLSMTVGKFKGGRKSTDWAQHLVPQISGQRAITASLAKSLPDLSSSGFGVEVLITKFAKKNNFKSKEIILENLTQVMKEEKLGLARGFIYRLRMYLHLLRSSLKRDE